MSDLRGLYGQTPDDHSSATGTEDSGVDVLDIEKEEVVVEVVES